MPVRVCSGVGSLLGKGKKRGHPMQDMLAQLEKLRNDAEDCERIGKFGDRSEKARVIRASRGTPQSAGDRG
jgi:hypothetical protein